MIPASYRVGWAARRSIDKSRWPLVFVGFAAAHAGFLAASGRAGPQLTMACAGLVIACMIVVNYPAPSDGCWSAFELSLPLGLRDLARARLVLAVGVWLAPVLLASGLGALGLLPAPAWPVAVIAALSAISSVVLAAVAREVLGLWGRWRERSMVVRGAVLLLGSIGFVSPAAWIAPALLLAAYAWWWSALGRAPAAFELHPVLGGDAASSGSSREAPRPWAQLESTGGAVSALLRRHTLLSLYPAVALGMTFLWAFSGQSIDAPSVAVFLILQSPASYAVLSSRVLRLEPLPVDRDRVFRYVAWPPLIAFALGSALALATAPSLPLAEVKGCCGEITLRSSKRHWRLARGDVPLVVGPDAETYQPEGHRLARGSSLLAYDPYEVGARSSHAFLVDQLRRLLRDQYQVALSGEQIEARIASGHSTKEQRLGSNDFPELRRPLQRASAARFTLLGLGILLALLIVIHPGGARLAPRQPGQRRPFGPTAAAVVLVGLVALLALWFPTLEVDPASMLGHSVVSSVAEHLTAALPFAVALAVVLHRTLQRRFRRMEAPPRAPAMDDLFIEV